jgi:hypothetical protein
MKNAVNLLRIFPPKRAREKKRVNKSEWHQNRNVIEKLMKSESLNGRRRKKGTMIKNPTPN